jgi:hypothetical protein
MHSWRSGDLGAARSQGACPPICGQVAVAAAAVVLSGCFHFGYNDRVVDMTLLVRDPRGVEIATSRGVLLEGGHVRTTNYARTDALLEGVREKMGISAEAVDSVRAAWRASTPEIRFARAPNGMIQWEADTGPLGAVPADPDARCPGEEPYRQTVGGHVGGTLFDGRELPPTGTIETMQKEAASGRPLVARKVDLLLRSWVRPCSSSSYSSRTRWEFLRVLVQTAWTNIESIRVTRTGVRKRGGWMSWFYVAALLTVAGAAGVHGARKGCTGCGYVLGPILGIALALDGLVLADLILPTRRTRTEHVRIGPGR